MKIVSLLKTVKRDMLVNLQVHRYFNYQGETLKVQHGYIPEDFTYDVDKGPDYTPH